MNSKLTAIGNSWFDVALNSIRLTASVNPNGVFYAAAFHMFYADGAKVFPPVLAMNDREYLEQSEDAQMDKWSPPEWRFAVIDTAYDAMADLYRGLSDEYAELPEDQQIKLERDHDQMMAAVCKKLTLSISSQKVASDVTNLAEDFSVVILDYQRDGETADQNALSGA